MDEIWGLIVVGLAFVAIGFILGMFALARVSELGKTFGLKPPRLWKLTPEQTFGLGGMLVAVAVMIVLYWR